MSRVCACFFSLVVACGASTNQAPQAAPRAAAAAPESDPLAQDIAFARSSTAGTPTKHLRTLLLTPREVRLLGDQTYTIAMPDHALWAQGMPAGVKRSGANSLFLVPVASWLENAHGERDISIVADASVPYRILVEVLFTCGQSGFSTFHLVVSRGDSLGEIVTHAPNARAKEGPVGASLVLLVAADGVAIKGPGGNVAPGCKGTGSGLAVPNANDAIDDVTLKACLRAVIAAAPSLGQAGVVAANPATPFSRVIAAMDALRGTGIDEIALGIGQ